MAWRTVWPVFGFLLLLAGTVLVFRAFDLHSHSASDTLRPFLITVGPVFAVARTVLRRRR